MRLLLLSMLLTLLFVIGYYTNIQTFLTGLGIGFFTIFFINWSRNRHKKSNKDNR